MIPLILIILTSFAKSKYSLIEIDDDNPETNELGDYSVTFYNYIR